MFSRGIRGISIDKNISAVAVREEFFFPLSLSRQLLSFEEGSPSLLLATPAGEAMLLSSSNEPTAFSKLTVPGVCMNATGQKIYKLLSDADIGILCVSLCDIAASFVIHSCDIEKAKALIKDNFTLEL